MKSIVILFAIRIIEGIGLGIGVFLALLAYDFINKKIIKED